MSLNAAALKILAEKGLSTNDIVELAEALESGSPRSSGAERQARYRQRKKAQSVTDDVTGDVTGDVTHPPKENKSNPRSASDEAGGEPPDPVKELFDAGISVLKASGHTEREARSLVGKWRKSHTDGEVLAALTDCRTKAIANPVEWIPKRLKARGGADPPSFREYYREEQRRSAGAVQ